jgi:hypothetical protein
VAYTAVCTLESSGSNEHSSVISFVQPGSIKATTDLAGTMHCLGVSDSASSALRHARQSFGGSPSVVSVGWNQPFGTGNYEPVCNDQVPGASSSDAAVAIIVGSIGPASITVQPDLMAGTVQCIAGQNLTVQVLDNVNGRTPLSDLTLAPTVSGGFRHNYNLHSLYVGCVDASSNPIENCQLSVILQNTTGSGGHAHDTGDQSRPPGEIVLASNKDSLSSDGSSIKNNQIQTFTTDASGNPVQLLYLPSLVAGDVIAKITETGGLGIPENDLNLHLRTNQANCTDSQFASSYALCQMPPDGTVLTAAYKLTGQTTEHPSNHYGTSFFVAVTLPGISTAWFNPPVPFALVQPLAINDMSLIDGGVFDLAKDWNTNPDPRLVKHKWHKWGDEADIGSGGGKGLDYWLPPGQRNRLTSILLDYHYKSIVEGNHWHITPSN